MQWLQAHWCVGLGVDWAGCTAQAVPAIVPAHWWEGGSQHGWLLGFLIYFVSIIFAFCCCCFCFVFFSFSFFEILFIYFWLCWVFISVRGLSPVGASGGHSSLWCTGLSLSQPLLLWSTGSRHAGSVIMAHGPSCSAACGIFPDQGSNPCPLHWQADSQLLRHQESPK